MALVERGTKKIGLMMETPNQRLRLIRELLQFNQTEFSKALGFKQSHISAVESEKKEVSVKIIYALVNKFKVSANWLLSGEGEIFLTHFDKVEYTSTDPETYEPEEQIEKPGRVIEPVTAHYLSETDLLTRIEDLETAIIHEGYLPLHHLCELYAMLLELPLDYSVLQKYAVPNSARNTTQTLSPTLLDIPDLTDFEHKLAYYLELEQLFKAWRTEFHFQFGKLYAYITEPETYVNELKAIREAAHTKESE